MSVTQTVEIPVSHKLTIDVPPEVPAGRTEIIYFPALTGKERILEERKRIELTITPETMTNEKTVKPLSSLAGIDKERDTMDAYFARKRADKEKEDAQFERMRRL